MWVINDSEKKNIWNVVNNIYVDLLMLCYFKIRVGLILKLNWYNNKYDVML